MDTTSELVSLSPLSAYRELVGQFLGHFNKNLRQNITFGNFVNMYGEK